MKEIYTKKRQKELILRRGVMRRSSSWGKPKKKPATTINSIFMSTSGQLYGQLPLANNFYKLTDASLKHTAPPNNVYDDLQQSSWCENRMI